MFGASQTRRSRAGLSSAPVAVRSVTPSLIGALS
jgi:hypothetical protein